MYDNNQDFYIAVDFDDTIVFAESAGFKYPEFGYPLPGAIQALQTLQRMKYARIILWSCREGKELEDAAEWLRNCRIEIAGINNNPNPYWVENPTKKIYYDCLIDDRSLDIPLTPFEAGIPGYYKTVYIPDWNKIEALVKLKYTLWREKHGLL